MKERSSVSALRHPWTFLLGIIALFCMLGISACGGGSETARVYDGARVLNTAMVQKAARNVPTNVNVYTVSQFTGTQADFQRAMAAKLANDSNLVVMGIDTQHNYQYVTRGRDVPLNGSNLAQASNAFAANYGNGDYTRATVASLNSLSSSMRANGATNTNRPGTSPLPWLIPLLILGGILFLLTKARRPNLATQTTVRPTYQPPQPERPARDYTSDQSPRPLQTTDKPSYQHDHGPVDHSILDRGPVDRGTVKPPIPDKGINPLGAGGLGAAAGGALGYELGKRQGEPKPPTTGGAGSADYGSSSTEYGTKGYTGKKKPDGGGGRFGKGGADYDTTDTSGGGTFGKGGADYDTNDTSGGGRFGKGGADYDR